MRNDLLREVNSLLRQRAERRQSFTPLPLHLATNEPF